MSDDVAKTVIHRKAQTARAEYQARAMSPAKALRLALATSADKMFDLPLVVSALEQVELSQTALRPEFSGGLMVLLDGPRGACGAVCLDAALLGALIEVQTTGRVTDRPPQDRPVTRTDAAIAAPLIDATLQGAEALLSEDAPDHWASGYRFGVMMEDARAMTLALHAAAFHVFRLYIEAGDIGRPGVLTVLLPVPEAPAQKPGGAAKDTALQRTLEQSAMDVPVRLEAVLGRTTQPLGKVCTLKEGDVLPFSMDRPMQIRLEASQKHVVALARLGQMNGARAVRLSPGGDSPPARTAPAPQAAPPRRADEGRPGPTGHSINDMAEHPALDIAAAALDGVADAPVGSTQGQEETAQLSPADISALAAQIAD